MADSSDFKLQLLDELCDKLDDSGIEGNVIERDSNGNPYVNIWYGSYEDCELQASQMFTVVVTGDSLYWNPHGCYEITPPGKYRDHFKDTFPDCRKSSGYYVWVMTGDKIIRTIKFLFDREKLEKKKENNVNWENEKRILEDATESINRKMDTCFVANMCTRAGTQEPVILVQDLYGHYIFEIYYDYKNKKYSVVPRGTLASIADGSLFVRNSIHNGFGFSVIPHGFLGAIYDKHNKLKKENNMNINIINKEFSLADQMLGRLKKCGIKYRMNIGKNGIYNPEEMIISTTSSSTGIETDICLLRSIPNSESTRFAFEVRWLNTNVPSYILANLKIDRVKEYEFSDEVIIDILLIERELDAYTACTAFKTFVRTNELPTIRAVDVIFNDPATIIILADGSKTVVKAENEKFDPEKGLAMAISKKVLGNKHDYYEVFKRYVGRYEKKQGKKNKNKNKENK